MTDLANLLNDAAAATGAQVYLGVPSEESRDPHPSLTENSVVVSTPYHGMDDAARTRASRLDDWLLENSTRYGYNVVGTYCGYEAILNPAV